MDKYRHRLCLVSVGLALFNQADKGIGNRIQNTEDRIQESVAQSPYLVSPVFCLLYSIYYSSDPCNAGAGRNADAGRSRGVSGREISKNGLRFLPAVEKTAIDSDPFVAFISRLVSWHLSSRVAVCYDDRVRSIWHN